MIRRSVSLVLALGMLLCCAPAACLPQTGGEGGETPLSVVPADEAAFLDTLAARTFRFFWECTDPATGLAPDRWPTRSFASVSATGFALTAYPIGVERGYVSRAEAAERTRVTLRFLLRARQDSTASGAIGFRGLFYHFVHPGTGHRFERVELSTVDTALLLAGVLFCQSWFDGPDAVEAEIRDLAEALYARADWRWAGVRPPLIGHGWTPEEGHLPYDWGGYSEAMLLYILALGSPTHPVEPDAWPAWIRGYRWGTFEGQEHLGFAPLFGHQFSHVWIDFRDIQDEFMRARRIDYFENSRRATLAQRAYAIRNPGGWRGYGPELWGLSACDGPHETLLLLDGRPREFHTYWARGASFTEVQDDGTICPAAAGGSIAFAPEVVIPLLHALARNHGQPLFSRYGFLDALNPTFIASIRPQHGRVVREAGWYDTDYLGIDQGPMLAMLENQRSGLVWRTMRRNPHVVRGLRAAGFTGGWLDTTAVGR